MGGKSISRVQDQTAGRFHVFGSGFLLVLHFFHAKLCSDFVLGCVLIVAVHSFFNSLPVEEVSTVIFLVLHKPM